MLAEENMHLGVPKQELTMRLLFQPDNNKLCYFLFQLIAYYEQASSRTS